jgi:hypothetical protein
MKPVTSQSLTKAKTPITGRFMARLDSGLRCRLCNEILGVILQGNPRATPAQLRSNPEPQFKKLYLGTRSGNCVILTAALATFLQLFVGLRPCLSAGATGFLKKLRVQIVKIY